MTAYLYGELTADGRDIILMTAYEYRIEYQVQRRVVDSDEDFVEIGFGSSCAQDSVDDAAYAIESYVQNRDWETEGDMPDPAEVDR